MKSVDFKNGTCFNQTEQHEDFGKNKLKFPKSWGYPEITQNHIYMYILWYTILVLKPMVLGIAHFDFGKSPNTHTRPARKNR